MPWGEFAGMCTVVWERERESKEDRCSVHGTECLGVGGGGRKKERVPQPRKLMQSHRGSGEVRGHWFSAAEFAPRQAPGELLCLLLLGVRAEGSISLYKCDWNKKRNRTEIAPVFVLAVWAFSVSCFCCPVTP